LLGGVQFSNRNVQHLALELPALSPADEENAAVALDPIACGSGQKTVSEIKLRHLCVEREA